MSHLKIGKRERTMIANLPFDCWCSIISFFKSRSDFMSVVLSVKGLFDYIKKIHPFCTHNIPFFFCRLPIIERNNDYSHVSNLVCDNGKNDFLDYLKSIQYNDYVKSCQELEERGLNMLKQHLPKLRPGEGYDRQTRIWINSQPVKKFTTLKLFALEYWRNVFPNLHELCFVIRNNRSYEVLEVEVSFEQLSENLRKLKIATSNCSVSFLDSTPYLRDLTVSNIDSTTFMRRLLYSQQVDKTKERSLVFALNVFPTLRSLQLFGYTFNSNICQFVNKSLENGLENLVLSSMEKCDKTLDLRKGKHLKSLSFFATTVLRIEHLEQLKHLCISAFPPMDHSIDDRGVRSVRGGRFIYWKMELMRDFGIFNVPLLESFSFYGAGDKIDDFPGFFVENAPSLKKVVIEKVKSLNCTFKGVQKLENFVVRSCDDCEVDFEGNLDGLSLNILRVDSAGLDIGDGLLANISKMKSLKTLFLGYKSDGSTSVVYEKLKETDNHLLIQNFHDLDELYILETEIPLCSVYDCPKLKSATFCYCSCDGRGDINRNLFGKLPLLGSIHVYLDESQCGFFIDQIFKGLENQGLKELKITFLPASTGVRIEAEHLLYIENIVFNNFNEIYLIGKRKKKDEIQTCTVLERVKLEKGKQVTLVDVNVKELKCSEIYRNITVKYVDSRFPMESTKQK